MLVLDRFYPCDLSLHVLMLLRPVITLTSVEAMKLQLGRDIPFQPMLVASDQKQRVVNP